MTRAIGFHDLGGARALSITGIPERSFARHLDFLTDRGYTFVSLKCLFNEPSQPLAIHLTLDDAFAPQLAVAGALLGPRRITATAFVVSDFVGQEAAWDYSGRRRRHAGWAQLRQWVAAGFGVGSHGRSHRDLTRLQDPELKAELGASRAMLEDRLGLPVTAVAYPFGRSDRRVRAAASSAGYTLGFGSDPARAAHDPLDLPRVLVSRLDTPLAVAARLSQTPWGGVERLRQRIIGCWAGATPLWQSLRGDYR